MVCSVSSWRPLGAEKMVNIWFSPNILACLTYRMLKLVLNVAEIYDNVKTIPFSMSIVVNMIFGGPSPCVGTVFAYTRPCFPTLLCL